MRMLRRCGGWRGWLLGLSVWIAAAGLAPGTAQAGFFDQVKELWRLPEEVQQLQDRYRQTRDELEEANRKLAETAQQSREALELYRADQRRLLDENAMLAQQNAELQQAFRELQQIERTRSENYRRTMWLIAAAAGLALLYFALSRLLRVWLRSR